MQLSFDIGGTFTDLVLLDEGSGRTWLGKTLTTYDDLSRAVSSGIESLLEQSGVGPERVDRPVIGATTLVTNALIERRGAPVALITTRGFADLIEIGREWRYDIYDLRLPFPRPLVPRELRLEISERLRADGTTDVPVALDEVDALVARIRDAGVASVAICLLNSYVSDRHERAIADRIAALAPELLVTTSAELAPEIREYERIVTTVANAYVRPIAGEHLNDIEHAIRAVGVQQPLHIMQSNGGITTTELARQFPIRLLESGPAAGALGGAYWGRRLGIDRLLAFDMGGTTAKVCLIDDGEPTLARTFEAAREKRHKRGSGMTIRVPVIELLEIGAGGGSIASLNDVGLLGVGPESASSEPGPACYGRGGTEPTVTDADVVLGYLDPEYFLGGRLSLDAEASKRAVEQRLGAAFDGDAREAAIGIVTVVEESMAAAMRIHATERGRDPRDYTVFAFGGAAPVHAASVARRLGARRVVIPGSAGVLAASGLQVASPTVDVSRTRIMPLSTWDPAVVREIVDDLRERGLVELGELTGAQPRFVLSADMRFANQGFEIEVDLGQVDQHGRALAALDVGEVDQRFRERYEQIRGSIPPASEAEVVSWRLAATGAWDEPRLAGRSPIRDADSDAAPRQRSAWFTGTGFVDVPVVRHLALEPGSRWEGPLIVQQPESTVVIGPGDVLRVDDDINLHLEIDLGGSQ